MWLLIRYYWRLCVFRAGPEQAPAYPVFLLLVALLFLIFNVFTRIMFTKASFDHAVLVTVAIELFLFLGLWSILVFKGCGERLNATVGAFLGQDVFLELLFLPVRYVIPMGESLNSFLWTMIVLLYILSLCWDLAVKGFILQRALNIGPVLGMALALALIVSAIYFGHYISQYSQVTTPALG